MNNKTYRLVYSRRRGMTVAVAETAAATGKSAGGETRASRRARVALTVSAALAAAGVLPAVAFAQIVPTPGASTQVIQTQNGLPQVNIARPSGAGVSINGYNQFDVQKAGAILNNSATVVQTQQAGWINGNPNYAPGQAARIIVNQVDSPNPSSIRGFVEIAGQKAELVISNPAGLQIDGGGFINTSRAVLTTGVPYYGADGSVAGFNVNRGLVTVSGAGLNASNVDQVDIISRAVQANAAIYSKNLNVIAGANRVDHGTLTATPIAGEGVAPAVAIDVAQLGGMYANRIFLVSNENGVGTANAGTIAAQAGDLTLQSNGRLVLTGKTTASGNLALTAAGGIENSGIAYAQQSAVLNTGADLANTGTLAAQQNTTVDAGSVNSTGTLGAGVNSDGSVAHSGDLSVAATGTLSATGQNIAGGNASLAGGSVNLAGSQIAANGNLALNATAGDLNLTGAKATAGSALSANTAGTLTNDNATLSSAAGQTIAANALSNRGGQIVSGGMLAADVAGTIANQGGTLQAAGALNVKGGTFDNSNGRVASLNGDGLAVATTGLLNNGTAGTIGGNGDVTVQAGQLSNAGSITAVRNLTVSAAQSLANSGMLAANGNAAVSAGTTLTNAGGTIAAGQQAAVSAANLDNGAGSVRADQLDIHATTLENAHGSLIQTGSGATTLAVANTLDNSNGSIQTNSTDLSLSPAAFVNDGGSIAHAGTGTLLIAGSSVSNRGGTIATNGALDVRGGAVSNQGGKLAAQSQATLNVAALDNSAGGYVGARDVAVTAQGALDNAGGTLDAAGALSAAAQSIASDGGAIKNSGTQATNVSAAGSLTSTNGGLIGGNGAVSVAGGSIDNSNGSVVAGGSATVQSGGVLTNTAGLIQGNGNVAVGAAGALGNAGGQIESNGVADPAATLRVSGASLDNTNGRIANVGTGATTLDAASITNAHSNGVAGAGTIGGNGDVTLGGQTLSNTQGGQVVAGHDLTLNQTQSVDNAGGALSGAHNLTMNASGASLDNRSGSIHGNGVIDLNVASLDNTSGKIGNDAGSGGSIAVNAGVLANQGGAIGSDANLTIATRQLSGDGSIVAGNDGTLAIGGDYTNGAANRIQANHDLTFTATGTLTNSGTLAAVNALTVNAANLDNQAGADLNSASTTLNATQAITNAGRIEGDTVATHSAALTNTGTVVGNTVTLSAGNLSNTGASAAIAAASQLNFYVPGTLSNTGAATIFSLGDINIAADGARDASGLLANRSSAVTNDQSTLEAQGNLEIATQTLTNSRPAPTVQTVTTSVDTAHQTKRAKYMACATTNADSHSSCTQAVWDYGYKNERTDAFPAASIVSQDPSQKQIVLNVNGQQQTIYYTSIANNGGSVTLTYWDGYNPNINYLPSTEYPTRSDAHHGYQRVEIARDTTTTTQQDQVVGAQAQQAQLLAGGTMTLANVGTIDNSYSAIAAGNTIRIGSTQQNGAVGNGTYGGTTVNNTGQTLYQYQSQNIVSTYAWNEDISRDVGTVVEAPIVLAPAAIGGTGGTIIANNAVQISATNVNNTNVAAANSATGATGGTLGANANASGVSTSNVPGVGRAAQSGGTVSAPQSVATGGVLPVALPTNGLFTVQAAPNLPYLVASDPRLTNYTKFISSDYMLGQLGLDPQSIAKRLGDGLYEEQMVRNQITQLTGRVYLHGYTSNEDEYRALMAAGVHAAKQFGLVTGIALTQAQMDALTSDMVWLVNQTVTLPNGSKQTVLAPVVYLAHTHANDLQPSGALIAADDVEIHAAGSAINSGVVRGGSQTVVTATDIVNRGGTIGSSTANGSTVVSASHDVINASGAIAGNRVAVLAGNDVANTTLVDTQSVGAVSGDSKVNTSLVGRQGSIASTGDLLVSAGRDLTVHGASISAGGDAQIAAGRNLLVDAVQSETNQSVEKNADHHWEASSVTNQTSAISSGGALAVQSGGDATFKGASVAAGKDLSVIAGGNLTATAVSDTAKYDNVAVDSRTRKEVDHVYDEHAVGTQVTAGGNTTIGAASTEASKGNVTLTGSSITAGMTNGVENGTGAANIASTGNVTINEAREEHDNYQAVKVNRGSVVSSTKTDSMLDTHANVGVGSTVSGSTVNIGSGRDLAVQGSTVVGTNDVNLAAQNNVDITTSKDTSSQDSYYRETHSGIGTSGLSVSIGTQKKSDTDHATSVTNNASTVGSLNGDLNVKAGDTLHVTGSDLIAGKNLTGTASNIVVDAATDTSNTKHNETTSSSGLTLGLSGSIGDAINGAYQQAQAAKGGAGDGRAKALHAIAAAGDVVLGVPALTGGALAGAQPPSIGVQISVGSSHSRSDASENQTTQRGSSVAAGGTTALIATGNGTPGSGDLTVAGSNVSGNDVLLAAKHQIDLQNTTNTDSTRNSNSSSGGSVGVSIGTNGIGVSASMSRAHGDGNSDAAMQNNSHVAAKNGVTLVSGGDTNVIGSNVSGRTVIADVGGNLNVRSVQDTTNSAAHQSSMGGGLSVSTAGGSASFRAQNGHADGSYAGVNEQAGIQAGDGGFDITVKGNTNLTGAVIASSATADKNTLTTGTLTTSDIANHSHYSANSNGVSAGIGVGQTDKAIGTGSVSGAGGVSPMMSQSDSGDQQSTTRSGVSAGTIDITNPAGQTQDLANLNRDTSDLNGTLAKTPNVQNLLNQQADLMNAASAAGQVVAQGIGAYADTKQKEAQRAADAAKASGDTAAQAAYQAEADSWAEGGMNRVMVHTAGGALLAGLGGGNALAGAAGAGVSAALAGKLNDVADAIGKDTGSMLLGNLTSNVLATAGGALVGGSAGAFTASNADLYNRQLHPDETKKIHDRANGDAAEEGRLTAAACYAVRCWAEYPVGSADYNAKYVSSAQASQLGPELAWINSQQVTGSFVYSFKDQTVDVLKGTVVPVAKDGVKVATGSMSVAGGVTVCAASGIGCALGAPAIAFGASEAIEGATGLYNFFTGNGPPGFNPLRSALTVALPPGWGSTAYDIGSLGATLLGLGVQLPYNIGFTEGIDRAKSIFGVTTSKWNNPMLNPLTKQPLPTYVGQGIAVYGVGSKAATIGNDIHNQNK